MTEEAPKHSLSRIATRNTCPICTALREYQNVLLKHLQPLDCQHFCNTHAWVVANSSPADSVSVIFLKAILDPSWHPASPVPDECDLCQRMHEEKESRLGEMAKQLSEPKVRSWLHDYGMLCSRHGREVMAKLPESLRGSVQDLILRNREEIVELLEGFLQRVELGSHTGGGILGRAAEFLVAQRGIEI